MKSIFNVKLNRLVQLAVIAVLTLLLGMLTGCGILLDEPNNSASSVNSTQQSELQQSLDHSSNEASAITSFEEVAAYVREHGQLPSNFITKHEAKKLGWVAAEGNLQDVAPAMSIGGDRFGNREGLLPNKEGRIWYEADINYEGGHRNADRIVYSNDGLIYMTTDHYKSFTEITD